MWKDAYFESKILTADPARLIGLLYEAAIDSVSAARHHLAAGDVAARSAAISRATAIICELGRSLDHDRGGSISRSLGELYEYLQRRLLEANLKQAEEPLAEALGLLSTLAEAWGGVQAQIAHAEAAAVESEAAGADPETPEFSIASRFAHAGITSTRPGWAL